MEIEKKEYIRRLFNFLVENETKMTGKNLADHLNWNGYRTNSGDKYVGERGIYTLIHSVYDWLVYSIDSQDEADNIAKAFQKPDGSYAYDK